MLDEPEDDELLEFTLGPQERRERIDKVLSALLADTTRGTVQRWIVEGRVTVNGAPCRAKDLVGPSARILVRPGPPPLSEARPDPSVQFAVLFEDPEVIVVDKPAGLVVHPARGHENGTLVNGLLCRPGFHAAPADPLDEQGFLRPGIVHRIDKETSGILVVAKTSVAREGLKAQFAAHDIERVYQAITVGVPALGAIETLHGRDPRSRLRFTSKVPDGRRAVTHIRQVEPLVQGELAFVTCTLETGRTHQIRMHLSEVRGTPLLCDELYGGKRAVGSGSVALAAGLLGRHALHAAVLGFKHPTLGTWLRFESPLPGDMSRVLATCRA